jgi:hypothetical protein
MALPGRLVLRKPKSRPVAAIRLIEAILPVVCSKLFTAPARATSRQRYLRSESVHIGGLHDGLWRALMGQRSCSYNEGSRPIGPANGLDAIEHRDRAPAQRVPFPAACGSPSAVSAVAGDVHCPAHGTLSAGPDGPRDRTLRGWQRDRRLPGPVTGDRHMVGSIRVR